MPKKSAYEYGEYIFTNANGAKTPIRFTSKGLFIVGGFCGGKIALKTIEELLERGGSVELWTLAKQIEYEGKMLASLPEGTTIILTETSPSEY